MSTPRLTLALALALALGCAPENENEDEGAVQAGVYIDLEIDAGLEPCGDLVGHMDRFIELIAGVLEVDLADRRYGYRWLTPESYLDSGCSDGSLGCAIDDTAVALSAPLDHELVHVVSFAVGRPPSFFMEGLAVVFGLPESPLRYGRPSAAAIGVQSSDLQLRARPRGHDSSVNSPVVPTTSP